MKIQKDGIFRNIASENWQMYREKGYEPAEDVPKKTKKTTAKKEIELKSMQEAS